jgi:hypothetical protein
METGAARRRNHRTGRKLHGFISTSPFTRLAVPYFQAPSPADRPCSGADLIRGGECVADIVQAGGVGEGHSHDMAPCAEGSHSRLDVAGTGERGDEIGRNKIENLREYRAFASARRCLFFYTRLLTRSAKNVISNLFLQPYGMTVTIF